MTAPDQELISAMIASGPSGVFLALSVVMLKSWGQRIEDRFSKISDRLEDLAKQQSADSKQNIAELATIKEKVEAQKAQIADIDSRVRGIQNIRGLNAARGIHG